MSSARQQATALFDVSAPTTPEAEIAALLAHQHAVQRWLAASADERPQFWRAVEAAWRRVRQIGCREQAQHNAVNLARDHKKLREK